MTPRRRTRNRAVALLIAIALLIAGALRPPPARANTEEALIIAGAALGGYILIVVIATAIIYGKKSRGETKVTPLVLRPVPAAEETTRGGLQFGSRCRSTAATPALLCW